MEHYADIIQECQDDLGFNVSSFHDIGMSALSFYSLRAWQIAQKNKSNSSNNNDYNPSDENINNNNQEQVSEEEYLTDQQEETLTDDNAYSEYFQDDFNKVDIFTS
jgi:hypothetical protein